MCKQRTQRVALRQLTHGDHHHGGLRLVAGEKASVAVCGVLLWGQGERAEVLRRLALSAQEAPHVDDVLAALL